jgi:hypothetical protein
LKLWGRGKTGPLKKWLVKTLAQRKEDGKQRRVSVNTATKVGVGAYIIISLVFDVLSGHLSFWRDLVIALSVAVAIGMGRAVAKARSK